MKTKIDDGGPAFTPRGPRCVCGCHNGTVEGGLRDWFAGKALLGMLSHSGGISGQNGQTYQQATAFASYALADAMLAERSKKGGA